MSIQADEHDRQFRGRGSMDDKEQEQEQDEFLEAHLHEDENENSGISEKDRELEKKWTEIKDDFRKKYSDLSNVDVSYAPGEFGIMLGRIQKKTGKSHAQLRDEINRWKLGGR